MREEGEALKKKKKYFSPACHRHGRLELIRRSGWLPYYSTQTGSEEALEGSHQVLICWMKGAFRASGFPQPGGQN